MVTESQIKIIVTEDHPRFRRDLCDDLLAYNIIAIAEAENGIELFRHLDHLIPDVILLDLRMPKMDGNETMKHLNEKYPDIKVIVLSSFNDQVLIEDYEARGAKGFITKDEILRDVKLLADIIKKIHRGGRYINKNGENTNIKLSPRQKDIVHLNAKGKSKKEIGEKLGLTESGVAKQEKKIMAKMGVSTIPAFFVHMVKAGYEFLRGPH